MSPFTFVLGIVIVVMLARVYRDHLRLKASQVENGTAAQARIDALEERVRTLEKIVTDDGFDLKREFNKL
ncbi:hypothetical protein [Dokdonella sp.]|uniref:hypothetical protein n=1 Tax=Dokdonella sp. TaxID=2291710 RepID=UPI0031C16F2D|nr:hypothetical protein [Dokdonella sp.]